MSLSATSKAARDKYIDVSFTTRRPFRDVPMHHTVVVPMKLSKVMRDKYDFKAVQKALTKEGYTAVHPYAFREARIDYYWIVDDGQAAPFGSVFKACINMLLCLFFGLLGAHKFYQGKWKQGILMLITAGGLTCWWIFDIYTSFRYIKRINHLEKRAEVYRRHHEDYKNHKDDYSLIFNLQNIQ